MATINTGVSKYGFKYSASTTGEKTTRTISGLNVLGGSESAGYDADNVATFLYNAISSLSTSTIGSLRWTTENEVII